MQRSRIHKDLATHHLGISSRHPGGVGGTASASRWKPRQAAKGLLFRGVFAGSSQPLVSQSDSPPGSCPRDNRMARLEAILLLAREPLSSRKLAQFTSLADGTEARTLVRVLNRYYQQQGTAFRIEEVAGGFQLACPSPVRTLAAAVVSVAGARPGCRDRRWRRWPSWPIDSRCCGPMWRPFAACSRAKS